MVAGDAALIFRPFLPLLLSSTVKIFGTKKSTDPIKSLQRFFQIEFYFAIHQEFLCGCRFHLPMAKRCLETLRMPNGADACLMASSRFVPCAGSCIESSLCRFHEKRSLFQVKQKGSNQVSLKSIRDGFLQKLPKRGRAIIKIVQSG